MPGGVWRPWSYAGTLVAGGIALFVPGPWITSYLFQFDFTTSVLIFTAVVNIHHFILDGAVWKLRDGRIAALLIDSQRRASTTAAGAGTRRARRQPLDRQRSTVGAPRAHRRAGRAGRLGRNRPGAIPARHRRWQSLGARARRRAQSLRQRGASASGAPARRGASLSERLRHLPHREPVSDERRGRARGSDGGRAPASACLDEPRRHPRSGGTDRRSGPRISTGDRPRRRGRRHRQRRDRLVQLWAVSETTRRRSAARDGVSTRGGNASG